LTDLLAVLDEGILISDILAGLASRH